jgi:hypothetical protein
MTRKMERLEGRDCLLCAYCYAIAIILQQLPSSVNQKKTHNNLQTSYNCCLLFVTHVDFLWLLPIVCSACEPFVVDAYQLLHM